MKKLNRSEIEFIKVFTKMLDEKSIESIRIDDVCEKAGYSRTAFYKNYKDKHAFSERIVYREAQRYSEFIKKKFRLIKDNSSREQMVEITADYLSYICEKESLYKHIFSDDFGFDSATIFINENKNKIADFFLSEHNDDKRLLPYFESFHAYKHGFIYYAARKWFQRGRDLSINEMRNCIIDLERP